jgi:hypothetical protein
MSTVAGLPPGALEFALPHAVNLAEAGSSIEERKAGTFLCCLRLLLLHLLSGYLFCSEIMPPHHDLKLMLVNTLRKVYTTAVPHDVPSQAVLGPRGRFSYAHSPRVELPYSVPERGCDPGRTDASSWVIIPQIVRHPFLARCQRLQSRLQDRIYANGPCMRFALWWNATRLCLGGCHLRSPDAFVIKTKLSLALRLLYASACIRLVHVSVVPGVIFLHS